MSRFPRKWRALLAAMRRRRVIYIHVPKTSGAMLTEWFTKLPYVTWCRHNVKEPRYRHPEVVIDGYRRKPYVFAFVRDPVQRCYSAYRYLGRGGAHEEDRLDGEQYVKPHRDFETFVAEEIATGRALGQTHLRPQCHWVKSASGQLLTDRVGRFESFQEDLATITGEARIDLREVSAAFRPVWHELTLKPATLAAIRSRYAEDYETFGYE